MKNKLSILIVGSLMALASIPAHADKTIADNDRLMAQRAQVAEIVKTDDGCKMMCDEMMKNPKSKKMMCDMVMKDSECMKMMHDGMKTK